MTKLYRPAIPVSVKVDVIIRQRGICGCGCGDPLGSYKNTEWDHCPCLALRQYDPETRAYDPPANDPDRIIAKIKAHHRLKTSHPRSLKTSIGSDQHLIAKLNPKRIEHFVVNKPHLPTVASAQAESEAPQEDEHRGKSSQMRPRWASQKMKSRRFSKGNRPLNWWKKPQKEMT